MLDSSSLDKALDLAFSYASFSYEAARGGVQALASLTGRKLEVIVAGIAGLLTFMLTVLISAERRPRNEIVKAWPSGPALNKTPEAASDATFMRRMFEAPRHIEKERLELTDELREQLQEKFREGSSEERSKDVAPSRRQHPWHRWRALYSLVMKLADDFVTSSTSQVTALVDGAASHIRARLSSFTARRESHSSCRGDWQRVAREGWTDDLMSYVGWYPWQCQQCMRCSYFRRRG